MLFIREKHFVRCLIDDIVPIFKIFLVFIVLELNQTNLFIKKLPVKLSKKVASTFVIVKSKSKA